MKEMTSAIESGLREAALRGDREAWKSLFEAAVCQVSAYVNWRCAGRKEWADDVNQDTWLTAAKSLSRFEPAKGSFTGWVCGLASNVIRNRVRDWKRSHSRLQPLNIDVAGKLSDENAIENSICVASTLAELPERYERALRAKYLDGLSVNEMASQWNESPKSVESLLTRAREAFRERFKQSAT